MKNILDEPILNITEDYVTYRYGINFDSNGYPNYYPPIEKKDYNMMHNIDEVLFHLEELSVY